MKNIFFCNFLFATICLMTAGCSTTKVASYALETLKDQSPPEGKALVFVVRPSGLGYAISMNVLCDNKSIGSTTGKRFIYSLLDPGVHHFVSKAENRSEVFLKVEAGKTYFIEQRTKMGLLFARCNLEKLEEPLGRKKLNICKLSGDCPAYVSAK